MATSYRLSARQLDIVDLVAQGCDNRTIGRELGISPGTVRNTLSAVYDVVGRSSRAYLATLYAQGRIPRPPDRRMRPDQPSKPRAIR